MKRKKIIKNTAKGVVALWAAIIFSMFFALFNCEAETVYDCEFPNTVLRAMPKEVTVVNKPTISTSCPGTRTIDDTIKFAINKDSMRVHCIDCKYYDNAMEDIIGTKVEIGRKCEVCNPDVQIEEIYEEPIEYSNNSNEDRVYYAAPVGSRNYSDRQLLEKIVASEAGSEWISIEDKAKVVASVMNMVEDGRWDSTISGVLADTCEPWGFNPDYNYDTSGDVAAAVDYYFENQETVFGDWTCNQWSGDGVNNSFYTI